METKITLFALAHNQPHQETFTSITDLSSNDVLKIAKEVQDGGQDIELIAVDNTVGKTIISILKKNIYSCSIDIGSIKPTPVEAPTQQEASTTKDN